MNKPPGIKHEGRIFTDMAKDGENMACDCLYSTIRSLVLCVVLLHLVSGMCLRLEAQSSSAKSATGFYEAWPLEQSAEAAIVAAAEKFLNEHLPSATNGAKKPERAVKILLWQEFKWDTGGAQQEAIVFVKRPGGTALVIRAVRPDGEKTTWEVNPQKRYDYSGNMLRDWGDFSEKELQQTDALKSWMAACHIYERSDYYGAPLQKRVILLSSWRDLLGREISAAERAEFIDAGNRVLRE